MTVIDIDVSDAQEPIVVPAGEEYKLRVIMVNEGEDKNGNPYLMPVFEVVEEPMAKEFSYFLGLPRPDMDAKQLNKAKWSLKSFAEAFDIDLSAGLDTEEWKGQEGWAILGVKTDDTYGEQNTIRKFVAGR